MPDSDTMPATAIPDVLETALQRLSDAVGRLRDAAERWDAPGASRAGHDAELVTMQEDRTRLALELDAALARSTRLREAQDTVLQRIERAEASVAAVIQALSSDEPVLEEEGS